MTLEGSVAGDTDSETKDTKSGGPGSNFPRESILHGLFSLHKHIIVCILQRKLYFCFNYILTTVGCYEVKSGYTKDMIKVAVNVSFHG